MDKVIGYGTLLLIAPLLMDGVLRAVAPLVSVVAAIVAGVVVFVRVFAWLGGTGRATSRRSGSAAQARAYAIATALDWRVFGETLGPYSYTTEDGRYRFDFELVRLGREVRIYIVAMPPSRGPVADGHILNDGRPYVCIQGGSTPENVAEACSWLVYWSEMWGEILRTGRGFN
jgi:hypothetical protein